MYSCVIIDDEDFAIEGLKDYIISIGGYSILKTYADPLIALSEITNGNGVDVIFMDIEMPSISGIDLAKLLRSRTDKLIFTSAHIRYGYEAFEVNADAFLHKPYSYAKFTMTMDRLFTQIPNHKKDDKETERDFFFVRNKEDDLKWVKIAYNEIIAIESLQNYIRIFTPHSKIVTYQTLSEIKKHLQQLPEFIQIHRSFLVSTKYIDKINRTTILTSSGLTITIGKAYRKMVQNFLLSHSIKL